MGDELNDFGEWEYGVDTIGFIRQALAGYVGRSSIISEMLQNADDAGATSISFHFLPDALVVRNNSHFRDKDFENISRISSGGKEHEEGKIGTWGTGFLSVYHLTDSPELLSSGRHFIFNPNLSRIRPKPTSIVDSTEFRLPWRRKATDLSRRLKAHTWSVQDIQQLKEEMITDAYRLVIHLRHIKRIEVYEGDDTEKPFCRVHCKPVDHQRGAAFSREAVDIEYRRTGGQPRVDRWLYYRAEVPHNFAPEGITIKDFEVALAFPVENKPWLIERVPGTLYNFLPTPISTGLAFQINGAFFPDNNRHNILTDADTHPLESWWNDCVLRHIGKLFTDAVEDIRGQVPDPRRFYELLPISQLANPILAPIRNAFVTRATTLPIVFTSLQQWKLPHEVMIGQIGSKLPELAGEYLDVLPNGAPQTFREFLANEMHSPALTWRQVVDEIATAVAPGIELTAAHPMINSREKLWLLYSELRALSSVDEAFLSDVPLCLGEDGALQEFGGPIWLGNEQTRRLLADTEVLFVESQAQTQFPALFSRLLEDFRGADLVRYLAQETWPDGPFALSEAPKVLGSKKHLAELLRFIHQDLHNADEDELRAVPLVRTESDLLLRGSDYVFLQSNSDTLSLLEMLGLEVIHTTWSNDDEIRAVYRKAGVENLRPRHVIDALNRSVKEWGDLTVEEIIDNLLAVYGYFSIHSSQLSGSEKEELRRLPLCLTQRGHLSPARGGSVELHRPTERGNRDDKALKHLNRLQLDHLLHSDLVTRDETNFLKSVLGVKPLNSDTLILNVILPYYSDGRLTDEARCDLLDYIGERMRQHQDDESYDVRQIWQRLKESRLVYCSDGGYRRGGEVYFPSTLLNTVFPAGYAKLHVLYRVPIAASEEKDQRPYVQSKWYWFLSQLGVNEHPRAADLVSAVEQIVSLPPSKERVEHIKRIYDLLNEEARRDGIYRTGEGLEKLKSIAWLPSRHDGKDWFVPREIYQASSIDLIGEQAPLLGAGFRESTIELRQMLEMPRHPSPSIVANHLLASAKQNREIKRRVYEDLGQRWDQLDSFTKQRLRTEAVVWDSKSRFWPAAQIYLTCLQNLFGGRRCYLLPPGGDDEKFLEHIGVKTKPQFPGDYISFLQEVAKSYADGHPLSENDRRLLLANLDLLGGQVSGERHYEFQPLHRVAVIPGRDNRLHLPSRIVQADRPELVDRFDTGSFPIVDDRDLSENANRFLRILDVPLLSRSISRRLIEAEGKREDVNLSLKLQQLASAFQRIAMDICERQGDYLSVEPIIEKLSAVRLFSCTKLMVEYVIDCGEGLCARGFKSHERALYDGETNTLFVKQDRPGNLPLTPLALELERILFPDNKQSIMIEKLLDLPQAEVHSYLDSHDIRRLHQVQSTGSEDELSEQQMNAWAEPEEEPETAEHKEQKLSRSQTRAAASHQAVKTTSENDSAKPKEQPDEMAKAAASGVSDSMTTGLPAASSPDVCPPHPPNYEAGQDNSEYQDINAEMTGADEEEGESGDFEPAWREDVEGSGEYGEGESDSEEGKPLPRFTGQLRPTVPVRPNIRKELERYGFYFDGDEPLESQEASTALAMDRTWKPSNGAAGDSAEGRIWQAHFTLTYMQRYEGFLSLHTRARMMLTQARQPSRLRCRTDFEEWEFELYVDYTKGIIYNRKELPRFFDAFNIPAGGVVYLELLHAGVVKLFWNRVRSRLTNVQGLESLSGDTFEEYNIPEVEFECEIDEPTLRAEKRLEDIDALFNQANGKRGIFQTICEVFDKAGRELSFDEIVQGVLSRRWVSVASIRIELSQRPCFELAGDDRWRFDPTKGDSSQRATRLEKSSLIKGAPSIRPTQTGGQSTNGKPERPVRATKLSESEKEEEIPIDAGSKEIQMLNSYHQELRALSGLIQSNGQSPYEQLARLAKRLLALGKRLQSDLSALKEEDVLSDDRLDLLWQGAITSPVSKEAQRKLSDYLWEYAENESIKALLKKMARQLATTQPEWRENIFYPLLGSFADKAFNEQRLTIALPVYEMLVEQGAGTFTDKLGRLKQEEDAQVYINIAHETKRFIDRWAQWKDAWEELPNSPGLRHAIQIDLENSVGEFELRVIAFLTQADVNNAFESCFDLMNGIQPLSDVWQESKNADRVWRLVRRVFSALLERARTRGKEVYVYIQGLRILATLPLLEIQQIPAGDCFEPIEELSKDLEDQGKPLAAAALLDYGLELVKATRPGLKVLVAFEAHERASLLYEKNGFPGRAYYHITQITERHLWKHLPAERFNAFNHRRYALRSTANAGTSLAWRTFIKKQFDDADLRGVVNESILTEMFLR